MTGSPDRIRTLVLCEAAMAVALALVLGAVRIVELPSGGSIGFGTLPLLAFALVRGPRAGILAATCAGFAHALAGGTIIHPVQLLLDYGASYAVLGLAGLAAARSTVQVRAAVLACGALQLAACTLSGVIFFGDLLGAHPVTASLVYNATTIVPESILAAVLVPGVVRAIARANPAEGWRLGLIDPPRHRPRASRLAAWHDARARAATTPDHPRAVLAPTAAPHAPFVGAPRPPARAPTHAEPRTSLTGRPSPFAREVPWRAADAR